MQIRREYGANIMANDANGNNVLQTAVSPTRVFEELLGLTLRNGAYLRAADFTGATALRLGVLVPHSVQFILSCRANVNAKDKLGRTPWHYLAMLWRRLKEYLNIRSLN